MWRAAYSQAGQELQAVEHAQRVLDDKAAAFCPFEEVVRYQTVSRQRGTSKRVDLKVPIFSRYLFIDCDDMPRLKSIHLVQGVVGNEDGMLSIPMTGRFAELLDLARGGRALSRVDLTKLVFEGKVGDLFSFIGGGFEGHRGKIISLDRLDSHGEVLTQIHMFGGLREIPVSRDFVGAILKQDEPRVAA